MSETLIYGYLVDLDRLSGLVGSKDDTLRQAIRSTAAESTIEEIDDRLEEVDLSFEEALALLFEGDLDEDDTYAVSCTMEVVLEHLGTRIDDESDERSLWNNMDFWLGDFTAIFEALGLETLAERWHDGSLPMDLGDVPEWPTFSTFDHDGASQVHASLSALADDALDGLPDTLFLEKGDEDEIDELRETMASNFEELRRWFGLAAQAGPETGLVLLFDGDG